MPRKKRVRKPYDLRSGASGFLIARCFINSEGNRVFRIMPCLPTPAEARALAAWLPKATAWVEAGKEKRRG